MKKITIILTALIMAAGLSATTYAGPPQDKKAAREAKQKEKRAKLEKEFEKTTELINNKSFVLEADWLSNQYGTRISVTPDLNFIRIDTTYAVLQIGSNYGVGYNGVGGITAEGRVTSWKVHENAKKMYYSIQANVMTSLGVYDITMNVSADGQATATITGMRRGQLNYTGRSGCSG